MIARIYNIYAILAASILALIMAVACDVHEFPADEPAPGPEPRPAVEVEVSFDATDWPLLRTLTVDAPSRGSRAADHALRYSLNIYSDNVSGSRVPSRALMASETVTVDMSSSLEGVRMLIPVELPEGDFSAVVWVDYVDTERPRDDLYYDTSDFASISIAGDTHPGNSHFREAFRGLTRFSVSGDGTVTLHDSRAPVQTVPVTASRPMARFEFVTTDLEEFSARNRAETTAGQGADAPAMAPSPVPEDYRVVMRYASYMPSTYNAHTDKPVDSRLGVAFDGSIVRRSDSEASLGFDHVFVNGAETTVQVALDIYKATDNSLIASTPPVTVPLRRNHHTVVRGRFLTSSATGGVGINPGFDGSFDIIIQ